MSKGKGSFSFGRCWSIHFWRFGKREISTENGRMSFVRQLEPDWHFDSNAEIVHQLTRFIKYLLYVTPDLPQQTASNVFISTSLEQFVGDQGRK
ncbi:peroxisome biogenesis protein 22-like [Zingiber officinale]|uniref:peroxisome biogenesis protein 22-like n=1 Tax=Zingiber officinale TaxID=94328 RepID=UPI001C4D5581|nr:peroxisome biogenesis protein 22-like [Zingiber officinale]